MNDSFHAKRISAVCDAMADNNFDALIISDPQSIFYLSGIWNEPYERMYVLFLQKNGEGILFANKLFNLPQCDFKVVWYDDTDDAVQLLVTNAISSTTKVIGIDKQWPARFLLPLISHCKQIQFFLGSKCVDDIRACKDRQEQQLMKAASQINDECIQRGFAFITAGVTEKQVAMFIDSQFVEAGAQGPSFETIVSFGANAADPHHSPDDTVIKDGDCILIDMGCIKDHYCSDMTRTNFYKSAPEAYSKIHTIVREANEAAERIIKPGVKFSDIDCTARTIIQNAGFGQYFTHRLGHFIGQSDHEQGDVSSANNSIAKEGMIFSIEPGIYLPGKFGVRIEDLVLVTKTGCEILNHVSKQYSIINK